MLKLFLFVCAVVACSASRRAALEASMEARLRQMDDKKVAELAADRDNFARQLDDLEKMIRTGTFPYQDKVQNVGELDTFVEHFRAIIGDREAQRNVTRRALREKRGNFIYWGDDDIEEIDDLWFHQEDSCPLWLGCFVHQFLCNVPKFPLECMPCGSRNTGDDILPNNGFDENLGIATADQDLKSLIQYSAALYNAFRCVDRRYACDAGPGEGPCPCLEFPRTIGLVEFALFGWERERHGPMTSTVCGDFITNTNGKRFGNNCCAQFIVGNNRPASELFTNACDDGVGRFGDARCDQCSFPQGTQCGYERNDACGRAPCN